MIESTHTVAGGIVIDLHYLVAIVPDGKTCYVNLHYQLLPKPVRLELGNSSNIHNREEYDLQLAGIKGAWKNYKRNNNR